VSFYTTLLDTELINKNEKTKNWRQNAQKAKAQRQKDFYSPIGIVSK
jgi:hypothetical protein